MPLEDPAEMNPVTGARRLGLPNWIRTLPADVFATGCLAFAAFALGAERRQGRHKVNWTNWPDGTWALAGFVAVILSAGTVYLWRGWRGTARALVLPLALALGASMTIDLPPNLPAPRRTRPSSAVILSGRALLLLLIVVLLGKLLLLQRYSEGARSKSKRSPRSRRFELDRLIRYQRDDLDTIVGEVFSRPIGDDGRIVQVEGRWGEGKSFVLRRLEPAIEDHLLGRRQGGTAGGVGGRRRSRESLPAVVFIDVWKHDDETDLHIAIMDEVLSTPCFLRHLGWLRFPLSIMPGRFVSGKARQGLFRAATKAGSAGVEVPFQLPRLMFQRKLESLVASQVRRHRRTVFVLDEMERGTPATVQAALTLTMRSLDLPGVVVILSYVHHLIMYKAFNPLVTPSLADIGSTADAVLFHAAFELGQAGPTGPLSVPAGDSPWCWWASKPSAIAATDDCGDRGREDGRDPTPPAQWLPRGGPGPGGRAEAPGGLAGDDLEAWLRRGFAGLAHGGRANLQARLAEKHLQTARIILHAPESPEDLAQVVLRFPSLRPHALALAGAGVNDDAIEVAIAAALRAWEGNDPAWRRFYEPPPLRSFVGEVFSILVSVEKGQAFQASRSLATPELLAACVLTAHYNAGIRYSRTRVDSYES